MPGKDIFVSAVITAAGLSTRMKTDLNKNYININSKTVLAHTLTAFDKCPLICEVIITHRAEEEKYVSNAIDQSETAKRIKTVVGGSTRQASVFEALKAADPGTDIILIHDAARCCVTDGIINETIEAAILHGAAAAAVKATDTCAVASDGIIRSYADRSSLFLLQTPQAFAYDLIFKAHTQAALDGVSATDDTTLAMRAGAGVYLTQGSPENIKITTRADLVLAKSILSARMMRNIDIF